MSSSSLSNWDGSQSPRKPRSTGPVPTPSPSHAITTAAKDRITHQADPARRSSRPRHASPGSSPKPAHRSSDMDEQNVQHMLFASDGPSSPTKHVPQGVSPTKWSPTDWKALMEAREGLKETVEFTENLTESGQIAVFHTVPLQKDGKTPATAISLSSSAASVDTDGDQSGAESDYPWGPVSGSANERELSVIPETPQKENRSLPPSPTRAFVIRESGSPEIEFYEDPGLPRYSDSPEIDGIAGPERGTSAEESTLVDHSAQSPAKSHASKLLSQPPRTPRTARIPSPDILSSPLTEQASTENSSSCSPGSPLPSTSKHPGRAPNPSHQPRLNRVYVALSRLATAERAKYRSLAKVPLSEDMQPLRAEPSVLRVTGSKHSTQLEAGPSTGVPAPYGPVLTYDGSLPHHDVHEKRKRTSVSVSPPPRPFLKKKKLRIDTEPLSSPSPELSTPLTTSPLTPLGLGKPVGSVVVNKTKQSVPSHALQAYELHALQMPKPNAQATSTATAGSFMCQRKEESGINDELFLMGWGEEGNDPLGPYCRYDLVKPLGGDTSCHKRTTSHRVADPAVAEAMLTSALRHLWTHFQGPLPSQTHLSNDGNGVHSIQEPMLGPGSDLEQPATSRTPSKTAQRPLATPVRASASKVADHALVLRQVDDMLDMSSPSRQNEASIPRSQALQPPISTGTLGSPERESFPDADLQSAFPSYNSPHASQGLSYNFSSHTDCLPANAMRVGGMDPFLVPSGLAEDISMHAGFHETHNDQTYFSPLVEHSQTLWMQPSEGVDQQHFIGMNMHFPSSVEPVMDEAAFNPTAGTIDPSLLAGPSNLIRVPTPPPTPPFQHERTLFNSPGTHEDPAPVKKAKRKRTSSSNGTGGKGKGKGLASRKNSAAADSDFDPSRDGKGLGKGKGKGKERASDVGFRNRPLCITLPASAPSAGNHADGKRIRKPTIRALEAQASGLLPLPSSPDERSATLSPRRARKSPQCDDLSEWEADDNKAAPSNATHLTSELTFCHQCRRANAYDKMRCVAIRPNGDRCGLRFCERCIVNRYENDIEFDHYSTNFQCPRCRGTCNCTTCARGRGETYVPTKKAKHVEPSAYFLPIFHQLTARKTKEEGKGLKGKARRARRASDDEGEDDPPRPRKRRRSISSEESDDSSTHHHPQTSRVQALSLKRSQQQSKPVELPVSKPKSKTKKQLEEEEKEREILASMALPQGAVWGTVYGLDGTSRIGIGVVADQTQRIVLKEGEGLAGNAGLSWPASMTWPDDSDDETMDTMETESVVHTSWPASEPAFGAAPSQVPAEIPPALVAVPEAAQPPSTPPRRAPKGNFVGKPRTGWMPRTPPPSMPVSPSFASEHSPNVLAFVGVPKRTQEKDQAVSFEQAQYLECVEGELTPEPDDDDEVPVSFQGPGFVMYEQQAALPYPEAVLNIAIMNAFSARQANASDEIPPPSSVLPPSVHGHDGLNSNDVLAPNAPPTVDSSRVAGDTAPTLETSTDP